MAEHHEDVLPTPIKYGRFHFSQNDVESNQNMSAYPERMENLSAKLRVPPPRNFNGYYPAEPVFKPNLPFSNAIRDNFTERSNSMLEDLKPNVLARKERLKFFKQTWSKNYDEKM